MRTADFIVVNVAILADGKNYLANLSAKSKYKKTPERTPTSGSGLKAPDSIVGTWVPGMAADPYKGTKGKQTARDRSAYFTAQYRAAIAALRARSFSASTKGTPLEWFQFERVVMDECHEATCPEDGSCESNLTEKKSAKGPLAARELMGVANDDGDRPLRARLAVWGLTGTPMLTSVARTTEMASLCGGAYIQGAEKHYRRMERVSRRDIIVDAISTTFSSPVRCCQRGPRLCSAPQVASPLVAPRASPRSLSLSLSPPNPPCSTTARASGCTTRASSISLCSVTGRRSSTACGRRRRNC